MDPAERRRFALTVIGATLIVFLTALTFIYIDKKYAEPVDEHLTAARASVAVGTVKTFNVYDYSLARRVKVKMICAAVGEHSIIYKENTVNASPALLSRIKTEFDSDIYPANKQQFLGRTIMGISKEDKIVMLLLNSKRGRPPGNVNKIVSGYYTQDNEQLKLYKSESNEARIIHIFIGSYLVDGDSVMETVAHETNHLKNWDITKNNVGLIIGSFFAIATVMTLYLGLSNLYLRSFS
jgi:hypothetical protein